MFQGPRWSLVVATHLLTDADMIQFDKCLMDIKVSKICLGNPGRVRLVYPYEIVNLSAFPGFQLYGILG